jgi:hypothetical protein
VLTDGQQRDGVEVEDVMTKARRRGYWLFLLVVGPLAADALYLLLGGTIDNYSDPPLTLVPVLGAVVVPIVSTPWAIGAPDARPFLRWLAAVVLGPVLASAWGVGLVIAVLFIACHNQECFG